MREREVTGSAFEDRNLAEQEARTLRSLIGDLLKTNQELREALLDAGRREPEPGEHANE